VPSSDKWFVEHNKVAPIGLLAADIDECQVKFSPKKNTRFLPWHAAVHRNSVITCCCYQNKLAVLFTLQKTAKHRL